MCRVLKIAKKRKRIVLEFVQKFEIIKNLRKGKTTTSITQIYGVERITVIDVKR